MRAAFAALALLAASCAAAPLPLPSPPVEVRLPEPPILESKDVSEKPYLIHQLTARDAGGRTLWVAKISGLKAHAPALDGGAFYLDLSDRIGRLDARGELVWKEQIGASGLGALFPSAEVLLTLGRRGVDVLAIADGAVLRHLPGQAVVVVPTGGFALADGETITRLSPRGEPLASVRLRHFPAADPSGARDLRGGRALGAFPDGTLLTGAPDGSLLALGPDLAPRFQLGVRGGVTRIEPAPGGDLRVLRAGLPPVVITRKGHVRTAQREGAEQTAAHAAVEVRLARERVSEVQGIAAAAPDDVWIVAGHRRYGDDGALPRVLHWDGRAITEVSRPKPAWRPEVISPGGKPVVGVLGLHGVVRGEGGPVLLVATRDLWHGLDEGPVRTDDRAPCLFERDGGGFRERRDLFAAFARLGGSLGSSAPVIAAAGPGGRLVACVDGGCVRAGDGPPRVEPLGEGVGAIDAVAFAGPSLLVGVDRGRDEGHLVLRDGKPWLVEIDGEPLPQIQAIAGAGPDDVWIAFGADRDGGLVHFDGRRFAKAEVPLGVPTGLAATSSALWVAARGGVGLHEGGVVKRIVGIEGSVRIVAAAGKDDVWVGGDDGLWHVTASPAEPDLVLAAAREVEPVIARAALVTPGADDGAWRIERVTLPVEGDAPLRWALGVVARADGTTWLWDDHRLVEVRDGAARRLHQVPIPARLDALRAAAPSGAGEGFFLADGLVRLASGRAVREAFSPPALTAVALAPAGALWAVSAGDDEDLPRVFRRTASGAQIVRGLPEAAWADVAAPADDEIWLVGGLSSTSIGSRRWPAGEGVLVHLEGRSYTHLRAPEGALLALAAGGRGEAWAVGVGGALVHMRGAQLEALRILGAPTLRAVAVGARGEVLAAGDDGALFRWERGELRRLEPATGGFGGTLSGVVAPGERPGWVVGPAGVFRIQPAKR